MSNRSPALVVALFVSSCVLAYFACQKAEPAPTSENSNQTKVREALPNQRRDSLETLSRPLPAQDMDDELKMRLLADYGAILVTRGGATPPPSVVFSDEASVKLWQSSASSDRVEIAGITIELQRPAMQALINARAEVRRLHLDITPRGRDAARRTYADTVALWQSRVDPGLKHWVKKRRITQQEANRIRALLPMEQVPEILRLEKDRLFFSKDFSKSILYSVAAPGTSQHIAMLAIDINENDSEVIRSILARNGWFQTVLWDLPHFTYLGSSDEQLPSLGLKKVKIGNRIFWVPDLGSQATRFFPLHERSVCERPTHGDP